MKWENFCHLYDIFFVLHLGYAVDENFKKFIDGKISPTKKLNDLTKSLNQFNAFDGNVPEEQKENIDAINKVHGLRIKSLQDEGNSEWYLNGLRANYLIAAFHCLFMLFLIAIDNITMSEIKYLFFYTFLIIIFFILIFLRSFHISYKNKIFKARYTAIYFIISLIIIYWRYTKFPVFFPTFNFDWMTENFIILFSFIIALIPMGVHILRVILRFIYIWVNIHRINKLLQPCIDTTMDEMNKFFKLNKKNE